MHATRAEGGTADAARGRRMPIARGRGVRRRHPDRHRFGHLGGQGGGLRPGRRRRSPRPRCSTATTPAPTGRRPSRWRGPGPIARRRSAGSARRSRAWRGAPPAIAVTAQGDGTWLVGAGDAPVGDAWIWLDARAAPTVERLSARARWSGRGSRRPGPGSTPASRARRWREMERSRAGAARPGRGGAALQGLALPEPDRRAGDRSVGGELDLRQLPHPAPTTTR